MSTFYIPLHFLILVYRKIDMMNRYAKIHFEDEDSFPSNNGKEAFQYGGLTIAVPTGNFQRTKTMVSFSYMTSVEWAD